MSLIGRGLVESFGVFVLPLSDELGWSRSEVASIFSLTLLANGASGPLIGSLLDRYGPRTVFLLGTSLLTGSFLLVSSLDSLWQFRLCLGVFVGLGAAAIGNVVHAPLVTPWFRGRMGLAMGVVFSASGFGMLMIVPLSQYLVQTIGWRASYEALAIAFACFLFPLILLAPFKRAVSDRPPAPPPSAARTALGIEWTLRRAMSTRAFWGLFGIYFCTSISVYGVTLQAVAYLIQIGFEPLFAASAFGFVGLISTCSMMVFGWLSDRFGQVRVAHVGFFLTGAGIVLLMLLSRFPSEWLLALHILLFGMSLGSRGPVVTSVTSILFSGPAMGRIYGTISLGFGIGAAAGVLVIGALYDWTGGYDAGLLVSLAAMALGYGAFMLVPSDRALRES